MTIVALKFFSHQKSAAAAAIQKLSDHLSASLLSHDEIARSLSGGVKERVVRRQRRLEVGHLAIAHLPVLDAVQRLEARKQSTISTDDDRDGDQRDRQSDQPRRQHGRRRRARPSVGRTSTGVDRQRRGRVRAVVVRRRRRRRVEDRPAGVGAEQVVAALEVDRGGRRGSVEPADERRLPARGTVERVVMRFFRTRSGAVRCRADAGSDAKQSSRSTALEGL